MQGWIKQPILIRERERNERDNQSDPSDRNRHRSNPLVPVSSVWYRRIDRVLSDAERNEFHAGMRVYDSVRRGVQSLDEGLKKVEI